MEALLRGIDELISAEGLPWTRQNRRIRVQLIRQGRTQEIRIARRDDRYVFQSIVAGVDLIAGSNAKRRALTYRIWRRNALKSIVLFRIDGRDRVVGMIEQPVESMHVAELRFYIETLAKESDRFEYVLTGRDVR